MTVLTRRLAVAATAAALTLTGTSAASAAPVTPNAPLIVTYDVTGSTVVHKSNITVPLGPTTITNQLLPDGSLRSDLPLPPVRVSFKAFGYLRTRATVVFTQVKPATGSLTPSPDGLIVAATAQYVVSLRNVVLGGDAANVGPNCQTIRPVTVHVQSPSDHTFDILNGGPLTGTYSIGKFQNCSTSTDLTNLLVPGPDNTIELDLSNGQINPSVQRAV